MSRQVWKLTERGYSLEDAKRISYVQQLRNGNIKEGTRQLTEQRQEYSNLHPNERKRARRRKAYLNKKAKKNSAIKSMF